MKKLFIVLGLVVLLVGYLGYRAYLYSWAEKYNEKQWETYVEAFRGVKTSVKPLLSCRNNLQLQRDKLLPMYEKALIKESNWEELSPEDSFYLSFYKKVDSIVGSLDSRISYYESELPEIQGGLFFITDYKGTKQKINYRIIKDRKPKTVETLNWYTNQFEKEIEVLGRINCADFDILNFDYPLSKDTCNALLDLEYSFATVPTREEDELEVEYQIRLRRFKEEYEQAKDSCENQQIYSNYWSF